MSGHSKWNNIKQRKGAEDARRAQVFTQMAKNIRIVVKQTGSGDVNSNAGLRTWVEKARAANMPKDKIQKAIDSGLGKGSAGQIQEVNYECFGPGGIGMIVMVATDNNNRTSSDLKAILTRHGGSMGGPGAVSYMFEFDREKQEFRCVMPLEVDEVGLEQLQELVDKLYEVEGVEGIYLATEGLEKETI